MRRFVFMLMAWLMLAAGAAAETELVFGNDGFDMFTGERYAVLSSASVNGLNFAGKGRFYAVTDGRETLIWQAESLREEGLQADILPQSLDDVRRMNRVTAYLNDDDCTWRRIHMDLRRGDVLPVYAAPSTDAYRGADGGAAVSLKEPFTLHADLGDGWWLIEHETSGGERRMGYVRKPEDVKAAASGLYTAERTLTLCEDAAMTDDPYGGRRALRTYKAGERVTCLGYFDALWAMAETKIDGKTARGFLPVRTLEVPQEAPAEAVQAQLQGRWVFFSGGELLGTGVEFFQDGTAQMYTCRDGDQALVPSGEPVTYGVYAAPDAGAGEEEFFLEICGAQGIIDRYMLDMKAVSGCEGFLVYRGEAGGGYIREGQTPESDHGGNG